MASTRAAVSGGVFSFLIATCGGFEVAVLGPRPSPPTPFALGDGGVRRRPLAEASTIGRAARCAASVPARRHRRAGRERSHFPRLDAVPSLGDDGDGGDGDGLSPQSPPSTNRPAWALPWMPTWLVSLRPRTQFLVGLCLYVFHLRVLTQHGVAFPFQLIPNDEGWFQSVGLDSLAGMLAFGGLVWLRRASAARASSSSSEEGAVAAVPPIWSDPTDSEAPWRLRPKEKRKGDKNGEGEAETEERTSHPRSTSVVAFVLLTAGYFSTGRFSLLFENVLYAAAGFGLPLTVPMHRSLVVLLGHLAWVVVGSAILAGVLSPKPFFGGGWAPAKQTDGGERELRPRRWYKNQWNTYWLWWTIGGYFVSAWLFNIADWLNQIVLPPDLFAQQAEGVVSQLINPENNDFLASLVGYIAPCLSAPWWEEVLYRGYLLPALGLFMGFWPSVFVSGILFSVHHLSVMGAIPLSVLGWLWAALYAKSGNILVTILIHGMWNSRVFLGSWLGL
ncbi:hypothetical protein ACHAWF_009839 [Thalassiosira exigua]